MSTFGLDYAWARPSIAAMQTAGVRFVCRYLSWLPNGKVITKGEYDALTAAGISVVLNWQYYGDWTHDLSVGYAKGQEHAREAERQRKALGHPDDRPIYFSVDFDATITQLSTVGRYFDGVASVLGFERTGAYGGYYTIGYLLSGHRARWGWQTYAWSKGQWDPRAHIQQYRNGVDFHGSDVDYDRAMTDDYGQWPTQGDDMAIDDNDASKIVEKLMNRTVNGRRVADILGAADAHALHGNEALITRLDQLVALEKLTAAGLDTVLAKLDELPAIGGLTRAELHTLVREAVVETLHSVPAPDTTA